MKESINAEMIRLARTSRGMKQAEVAERLGIKQPTYSKIENGSVALAEEHLPALSDALGYPQSFFRQSDRVWGPASPHHRSRKALSKSRVEQLEAELNVLRLQVRRLLTSVDLEQLYQIPSLPIDEVGTPADAAREVRRLWRLPRGPVQNVTRLLEDASAVLIERPMPEQIDAVSIWGFAEAPVVLMNANFSPERKRQTLAHELGHLVMHAHDVSEEPEKEANAFARHLLMPADEIRHELRGVTLQRLPDLKRRWKASMRNLVYHAEDLGEITRDQARYLFMRMNQRFGSKSEPVQIPEEPPTLMGELIGTHISELDYKVDELAAMVHANEDEFRSHHGLVERQLRVV